MKLFHITKNFCLIVLVSSILTVSSPVRAEGGTKPLTTEGINGDADREHRAPLLSVGVVRASKVTQILVDASVQNGEYSNYPVRFDFFVNRKLFTSQMRSKALPGPIGIEVPIESVPPPFNYTVVATLLHPNRQFTSMVEGAVFATNLSATLDCTLSVPASASTESAVFVESSVGVTQSGADSLSLALSKAKDESGSETIDANGSFSVNPNENSISGNLALSRAGKNSSHSLSGTTTFSNGNLSAISLASSDGEMTLVCS